MTFVWLSCLCSQYSDDCHLHDLLIPFVFLVCLIDNCVLLFFLWPSSLYLLIINRISKHLDFKYFWEGPPGMADFGKSFHGISSCRLFKTQLKKGWEVPFPAIWQKFGKQFLDSSTPLCQDGPFGERFWTVCHKFWIRPCQPYVCILFCITNDT